MAYSLQHYAKNYLRPFNNDFWRWSDDGTVIEWFNGQTIAFREEVINVLNLLEGDNFYPFGTIVLALAACQENWMIDERATFLEGLIDPSYSHANTHTRPYLKDTLAFMTIIRSLPTELRRGVYKTHLVRNHVLIGDTVPGLLDVAMPMIIDLQTGKVDEIIRTNGYRVTSKIFESILAPFDDALLRTATVHELESSLRTGIRNLPPAADGTPEPTGGSLIDELLADPETAGIARVTKHLVAALNIPMHTAVPAEQLPMGGVADITNRGTFDKLLLTELAQDDALLTARLVNNEALYLRREEPPDETPRERTILIDTTLRMWGTSRILAVSTALAYLQKADPETATGAYIISADDFTNVDLTTRRGVVSTLEKVDPGLDCVDGVNRFFRVTDTKADLIFITEAETITQPEMQLALQEWRMTLKLLVTVNRNGEINFYEYIQGSRKLISAVKLTLDDTLFAAQPAPPTKRAGKDGITTGNDKLAFLSTKPCPLYFPSAETIISNTTTYHHAELGVVTVTRTNRLLLWRNSSEGAIELLHNVETGSYCFGSVGKTLFLLVYGISPDENVLYSMNTSLDVSIKRTELKKEIHLAAFRPSGDYFQIRFFVKTRGASIEVLNPLNETWEHSTASAWPHTKAALSNWKHFINNGYSVLQRVDGIAITQTGQIALGELHLSLVNDTPSLRLVRNGSHHKSQSTLRATGPVTVSLTDNTRVRFQRFEWPNGSTATIDSRGLLHLKNTAAGLPEITIVLAIGVDIAAWASDGKYCGSTYFTGSKYGLTMMDADFYNEYIQRYIDNLQ